MAKRQQESGFDSPLAGQLDEQLLAAFAAGDHEALGALAGRYERTLLGLAMGVLGSEELAREAVQEAWVRVIRHAATFKGRSSFKTWMYRIVINRCKDIREKEGRSVGRGAGDGRGRGRGLREGRSSGHESAMPDSSESRVMGETQLGSDSHLAVAELNGTLRRAVDELDERKRMTVLVCYHEGITHEVAAEILGVPLGTLKSRLNAALKELRIELVGVGQEGVEDKR